jgi:hypothetical protein
MAIHYNLHRFGQDQFAVGQLINGDLPTNDKKREFKKQPDPLEPTREPGGPSK